MEREIRRARFAAVAALCMAAAAASAPASAKDRPRGYIVVNEAFGLPVFPGDIADRPYEVIGEVKAGVRKATIFSKASSQRKIYKELWERARRKGAHAVINASYGKPHVTALSWGQTNAGGTAIRFTGPAPAPR